MENTALKDKNNGVKIKGEASTPAAGRPSYPNHIGANINGWYWTRSLGTIDSGWASCLSFSSNDDVKVENMGRIHGLPIRPVRKQ